MLKVKIFEYTLVSGLEKQMNNWLGSISQNTKIIDIKYSCVNTNYTALVLYEEVK